METFHGNGSVIRDHPTMDKGILFFINHIGEDLLDSFVYGLVNNLHNHIAKDDKLKFFRGFEFLAFGNKGYECFAYNTEILSNVQDLQHHPANINTDNVPILLIE